MALVGYAVTLGISVGLQALSWYLQRPDEERSKARKLKPVEVSIPDEGTPVPIVYGDVILRDLKVIWSGGGFKFPLPHSQIPTTDSNSDDPAAHVYGATMAVMVAVPSASDALIRALHLDGKRIVSATSNESQWGGSASFTETIGDVDPFDGRLDMWGGPGAGGGVWGEIIMYRGTQVSGEITFTNEANGTVTAGGDYKGIPDGNIENQNQIAESEDTQYREMMYAVFKNFMFGESPRIPPIWARVRSFPDALGYGRVTGTDDANPAEVIWHLLTDDFAGVGMSSRGSGGGLEITELDLASFQAAAETLEGEGNGASLAVYAVEAGDVIAELLNQIDGVLYEDPESGKLHLKLIRDDYDEGELMTLDESNVRSAERSDTKAIANEVRLTYQARTSNWDEGQDGLLEPDTKDETVTVRDDASLEMTGRARETLDISMPFIHDEDLAREVADRELQDASTPTTTVRLLCNREAAKLRPGDAVKWTWPDYGVTEMVLRVTSVDWGEYEDNRVRIEAVRDRFNRTATALGA